MMTFIGKEGVEDVDVEDVDVEDADLTHLTHAITNGIGIGIKRVLQTP
jgi:hypothetical protein